ncbi:MAG TPA: winged helix-turn-helix domain-containing protein [Rudaea sp.]|uniref:winged helix-turn-helix domain-containing protein n=1 Tax=Rudaea sp. TaxID=2136325 RepID=UPI002F95BC2E
MTDEENNAAQSWIVFDQVEIDLSGRRLFVAGADMPLEPKAFAVLALLARHPGRAFGRDEILDAVWGHRHVTPGVLNRVITLLRQALGESAQRHQYLHTLHGVGYRFDAQVRFAAERAHADTRTPIALETADTDPTPGGEPITETPAALVQAESTSEFNASDAARANVEAVPAPAIALPQPAAASRKSTPWKWIVILVAILAAAWFWSTHNSTPQPLTAVAQPTLVVLPLHPVGNAANETALAEGLSEELITRLSRVDGLHLISNTSATLAQSGKFDLPQLANKLKVTHALEGSLREDGDQLRIDLRLIEVPGGNTLWAQNYDRSIANVFALESDIAQAVAGALTLRLGLAANASPGDTDPELFREYLEARSVQRLQDREKSIAMLRTIIAKAPDYARGHASLARTLASNIRTTLASPGEIEEARREAARALELDPSLAETQTALAILACRAADWARCVELFKHSLALDPADSDCRTLYAYWLAALGYLKEALGEAEIGSASDPLSVNSSFVHGRVLDTLGRHDEAKRFFDLAPSTGWSSYAKWFNAFWRHDVTAARELANLMPESDGFRESYLAATETLIDPSRWTQAMPLIDASERNTGRTNITRLIAPNPDYATLIPALEKMLRDGFPSYYLLLWMPEYPTLRRDLAFQDFLHRTRIIDYWRVHGWPAQCKPEGDGARCE